MLRVAHNFFIGIANRLEHCAVSHEKLGPNFSSPESFIDHALLDMGVRVQSAGFLSPFVVSIDGRMSKWCDRCGYTHTILSLC